MEIRELVKKYAIKIQGEVKDLIARRVNEAEFREVIDPLLIDFCKEAGLNPLARLEYTLASGRADTVFNRLVIEYKRPGVISEERGHQMTGKAVEQVRDYILDLAKAQRHEISRVAGVVFDGRYIIFVRYLKGDFLIEKPVPVTRESLERFLNWLVSTASGIALTAENLNNDFSIEQLRTQNILRALMKGLERAFKGGSVPMVKNLFEQWRIFFSQSIDYSEAFGGRKLEPLKKWVKKAGLDIKAPDDAERFFFVLHTYFALLVKLLAWLSLSRHMGVKLGVPGFGELVSLESDVLRSSMERLESGGIFREYGLMNLLEGDFFAWYLYAWDSNIEDGIRELLRRLDDYDPATLSILPEESRDLFKKLYHYLLPREVRHNLGEYYTPDWLAQRLLNQVDHEFFEGNPSGRAEGRFREKLFNLRWLDPACGSGTFLVLIISRMKELGQKLMVREVDLLNAILNNVVGFDLNPLAVLTARVNYLLAIADLLEHRRGDITIPVYLADSVRTPAIGERLEAQDSYEFPTAVGTFRIPEVLCRREVFDRFCDMLEEGVRSGINVEVFLNRLKKELSSVKLERGDIEKVKEVYERIYDLHRQGMNGLWARLLKNNFAPLTVGQFDYVVGNPPWVNWEHLPDEYRRSIAPLWVGYGLFQQKGMRAAFTKDDISVLMTYVAADKLLKEGGKLGFLITQSVFKSELGGKGFRQFRILQSNGKFVPLKVLHVDDMVSLQPFEGASNRTAVMVLEKGKQTSYPVPYTLWRKVRGARFTYDSTLGEVTKATVRLNFVAEPVDPGDLTSPWLTARRKAIKAIRKVLGKSDYEAHEGVNTGGANAVYWVDIVYKRPDGLVTVRNITEGAKVKVDEVTETIEPDLLYPLLRGRDVQRWVAEPSAWIIVTHKPSMRLNAIPEKEMQERYPRTYGYFKQFEQTLLKRGGWEVKQMMKAGKPFYSMSEIGDYTFAPWKVVWPNIASALNAAVVGLAEGKVVVPQHIVTLVACETEDEAHYICALINSSSANFTARAYSQEGGKSFGDPHILEHIRIPRFDPKNPVHLRLAELSMQAHEVAKLGDEKRLREIEEEIDRVAGKIWGLSEDELEEIRGNLEELSGELEKIEEEE
jgi:SAM-dependent methyltransferase